MSCDNTLPLMFYCLIPTCTLVMFHYQKEMSHVRKLEGEMWLLINLLLLQPLSPLDPHKTKRRDNEPAVEKARYNSLSHTDSRAFSNPAEAVLNSPLVQPGIQPVPAVLQNTLSSRNPIPNMTSHSANTLAQQDRENGSTDMSR